MGGHHEDVLGDGDCRSNAGGLSSRTGRHVQASTRAVPELGGGAADNTICSNIGDLELELSQPVVAIANGIPRPLTLDSVERHTIGGTPAIVAQFNEPPNPGENKITSMTVGGRSFLTCDGHIFPLPGYVAPEPVPTLTEWAMIFLAALLAGAAALDLQRRRCPA